MGEWVSLETQLTRRRFLLGTAALSTTGMLLGACASDEDGTSESGSGDASADDADSTDEEVDSSPVGEDDSDSGTETSGATLNLRCIGELVSLVPLQDAGSPDELIINIIYSKLVMQYPEDPTEILPDLATDWELSDDGLEYTFQLREGAQWHKDYGEVTAEDVVWSLNRARDPELGTTAGDAFIGISDVVADGDYTVVITLGQPEPAFLYASLAPWGYIANQQAIEEKGDAYSSDPVGSGSYIFEEWVRGEEAILAKDQDHWLHEGNVDRAHFKFLLDDSVAELALRSGDLDGAYFLTTETQRLVVDNPDLNSINEPANQVQQLYFPMTEDQPTTDIRVRRAIAIALDRELIAEQALDGMALPAHSPICPGHLGYVDTEFFAYDPEQAVELLSDAGYPDGLEIELITYNVPPSPDIVTVAAAQLEEVGITPSVNVLERADAFEQWEARDFEVLSLPLGRDTPEPLIYSYYTSDGIPFPNTAHYTGIADLADSLRTEADISERENLIQQIAETLAEDVASVPIVYKRIVFGMREGLETFPVGTPEKMPLWLITVNDGG